MTSEENSTFKSYLLGIMNKEKQRITRLSLMDMQNLVKQQIFSQSFKICRPPEDVPNHKTFLCVDCGDRFLFQSSYTFHMKRQSVKITYNCRTCQQTIIFSNRCNLLKHIRSHMQHSNTLNLIDLKIEPLFKEISMKVFYNTMESEDVNKDLNTTEIENDLRTSVDNSVTLPVRSNSSINLSTAKIDENQSTDANEVISASMPNCFECLLDLSNESNINVARAAHYKQIINGKSYKCSICKITLPSICSLKAHMRLHHLKPPLICPCCGHEFKNINDFISIITHPCSHMYRKVYVECNVPHCIHLMSEENYSAHQLNVHMKLIYKCSQCSVACFTRKAISIHAKTQHEVVASPTSFYQCVLCPGRLVPQSCLSAHINSHKRNADRQQVFVCYKCEVIFKSEVNVLSHALVCKDQFKNFSVRRNLPSKHLQLKQMYKVKKKCNLCQNAFTYTCFYSEISYLPTKCPYCRETSNVDEINYENGVNEKDALSSPKSDTVKCHICKVFINIERDAVKEHYMNNHKDYNFIDVVPVVEKLDLSDRPTYFESNDFQNQGKRHFLENNKEMLRGRKRKSKKKKEFSMVPFSSGIVVSKDKACNKHFTCAKCSFSTETRQDFKEHVITHRNMSTAYQCIECGLCFVVKPSFATHLFISHSISDVDEYINKENLCKIVSDSEQAQDDLHVNEPQRPLLENQCKICLEQFSSEDDLEKHFRVHGMAFLLSKTKASETS